MSRASRIPKQSVMQSDIDAYYNGKIRLWYDLGDQEEDLANRLLSRGEDDKKARANASSYRMTAIALCFERAIVKKHLAGKSTHK